MELTNQLTIIRHDGRGTEPRRAGTGCLQRRGLDEILRPELHGSRATRLDQMKKRSHNMSARIRLPQFAQFEKRSLSSLQVSLRGLEGVWRFLGNTRTSI